MVQKSGEAPGIYEPPQKNNREKTTQNHLERIDGDRHLFIIFLMWPLTIRHFFGSG